MKQFVIYTTMLIALLIALNLPAVNHLDLLTTMTGEFNGSWMGYSVISLDFNGDGIKDLVANSPNWNPTGVFNSQLGYGKLYFYMGGTAFDNMHDFTIAGTFNVQYCGRIYNAGDVNGDGKEDIAMITGERVIPPGTNHEYSLYIFYGRDVPSAIPDYTMNIDYSPITTVRISPLGDVNHDGYDDIALVHDAPGRFYMAASVILGYSFEEIPIIENHDGEYSSLALSGIGDVNNDGIDDFHLYYPASNTYPYSIKLAVYSGGTSFPDCDSLTICQNTGQIIRAEGCALGDVNGDGIADFVSNMSETAKVWFGSSNLSTNWNVELSGEYEFLFGGTGTNPGMVYGDLNGDGFDDVIGSNHGVLIGNGRAGIWLGRAIFNGTIDYVINSPHVSEDFGWSKAAGDFNNDGYCDVAFSAPGDMDTNFAPGYVYVYAGNAELADTTVDNEDNTIPTPAISDYEIEVYPNPVVSKQNSFNVKFVGNGYKSSDQLTLTVYNVKGQKLQSETIQPSRLKGDSIELELPNSRTGLLIIKISEPGRLLTSTKVLIR